MSECKRRQQIQLHLGGKQLHPVVTAKKKRSPMATDLDDDTERAPKHHRACENETVLSSIESNPQTLDSMTRIENMHQTSDIASPGFENREKIDLQKGDAYYEELRRSALQRRRPAGYVPC